MSEHIRTGRTGENAAIGFLKKHGYEIICRNWKSKAGEIDIIARDGDFLVIVEVKTKRTAEFGTPEESVNSKKQKRIINLANNYIKIHNIHNETRFDVIAIILKDKSVVITHHKGAFSPFD